MWQATLLIAVCVVVYHEAYLGLAPVYYFTQQRLYALEAIERAQPFLNTSHDLNALAACVRDATVKYVGCGGEGVSAYVTRWRVWAPNEIYLTTQGRLEDVEGQVCTLLHECTHLAWGTLDYAYVYDPRIDDLTWQEVADNADSYVTAFLPFVREAVSGAASPWQLRIPQDRSEATSPIPELYSSLLRGSP
jgi:hypothetical protein